jgi:hypothetical protein
VAGLEFPARRCAASVCPRAEDFARRFLDSVIRSSSPVCSRFLRSRAGVHRPRFALRPLIFVCHPGASVPWQVSQARLFILLLPVDPRAKVGPFSLFHFLPPLQVSTSVKRAAQANWFSNLVRILVCGSWSCN